MFISMNPFQVFPAYSIPNDVCSENWNLIETKFIASA